MSPNDPSPHRGLSSEALDLDGSRAPMGADRARARKLGLLGGVSEVGLDDLGGVLSPLAARPYDLRHAAVSLWLNSGVPAPDVAERAGHGVDVLLRVYAGCIHGGEAGANQRIENALIDL
jgi:integrase